MTRSKGGLTRADLKRAFAHHVAIDAEKVRGLENSAKLRPAAASLGAASLTYHLSDPDRVVFCFAHADNAKAFSDRFGGEILKS
jgi:hypothetical protein